MKTYSAKAADIQKEWIIVDAENAVLGRLGAFVASRLRGKHKPMFTPHMDCGDNVIVINADKVRLTGNKRENDIHYWHTGFPGGIKSKSKGEILDGRFPERVVEKAVERMIPKTVLGNHIMKNLKVYAGSDHPHEAQKPKVIKLEDLNEKNKR